MANPKKGDSVMATADGKPMVGDQQTTIVDLTDGTLGTASDALAEITSSYVEATIANSFASLAAKITAINAVLEAHGLSADS
jgi:hypothetical protein